MRTPFPLQWPAGWDRTPPADREPALFRLGMADALYDLLHETDLLNASQVVVTSDLPVSERTGLPYANGRAEDPGIAVWCVVDGQERVFACDRWNTPAGNIRAIGKTIEALRGLARWGAADMVTRAFQGFAALPPGGQEMAPNPASTPGKRPWREVLGLTGAIPKLGSRSTPSDLIRARELVKAAYRSEIRAAHPDAGGTHERAAELGEALTEAEAEISKSEQGEAP